MPHNSFRWRHEFVRRSNRFMRARTALRRPFIDDRSRGGLERTRLDVRGRDTGSDPAEVPSGANPRAPLDRTPCRCAGPLARLGACHTH